MIAKVEPIVRDINPDELKFLFMMGFDTWGKGKTKSEYLQSCITSSKYAEGVFKALCSNNKILSSLIVYRIGERQLGIGSVATVPELRGQGFASMLVRKTTLLAHQKGMDCVFLHSDIGTEFYQRLGYVPLPDRFQFEFVSICMIHAANPESIWSSPDFMPPSYF